MGLFKKSYVNVTNHIDSLVITHDVKRVVSEANIQNGLIVIFIPNATSAVTVLENDPKIFDDLKKWIETEIPSTSEKRPERRSGTGGNFAHLRAQCFAQSLSVPIAEGKLQLGNWQEVVFLDFDDKVTRREYFMTVLGEAEKAQ